MKKCLIVFLCLSLLCACHPADQGEKELSDEEILMSYYDADSYKVEFNIKDKTNEVSGKVLFTEQGVYMSTDTGELNEDEEVGYAEDEGGIFSIILQNDKVRPISSYLKDEDGNPFHGLYENQLVPSLKLLTKEEFTQVEPTENEHEYSASVTTFSVLTEIAGISSTQYAPNYISLTIENDSIEFVFYDLTSVGGSVIGNLSMEISDKNETEIGNLKTYLAEGGTCDTNPEIIKQLFSSYNYVGYLYTTNDKGQEVLFATEYYHPQYSYVDYANPEEKDIGYIGVPSGSNKTSGIYSFHIENGSVTLDTLVDVKTNDMKNFFTYPGDLDIVLNADDLTYSVLNDAYISVDLMTTIEVAQVFGLEDYVNILSPYCSAIQFHKNEKNINKSQASIWYVYEFDGSVGIYAKTFTDFGQVHLENIETFLKSL